MFKINRSILSRIVVTATLMLFALSCSAAAEPAEQTPNPAYFLSPASPNANNWYNTSVVITPPQGYQISTSPDSGFDSELKIEWTTPADFKFYLKNTATGGITDAITLAKPIKVDKARPRVEFEIPGNAYVAIGASTFPSSDVFYKPTTLFIYTNDDASGVDTVQYYIADHNLTDDEVTALFKNTNAWKNYSSAGIPLHAGTKCVVYAKATDRAGYMNEKKTPLIHVYEDLKAEETPPEQVAHAGKPVALRIRTAGSTIPSVSIGGKALKAGTDYTLSAEESGVTTVTLSAACVDALPVGSHAITLACNPLGKPYAKNPAAGGHEPTPLTLTLTLREAPKPPAGGGAAGGDSDVQAAADKLPKTGDASSLTLWAAMLLLGGGAMLMRRKRAA